MAALNEEQSVIRDQAQSWTSAEAPVSKFRAMRDSGVEKKFDDATWKAMVDMGWTGILVPEEYGGSDLGYLTFGVILEELGRQLTASPLFASALVGVTALNLAGNKDQKQHFLPKVVDGSEILSLAMDEGPRYAPEASALKAEKTSDGYTLSGHKTFVAEGMTATTLIVAARTSGKAGDKKGITLFLVSTSSGGISRSAINTVDSRGYARIDFAGVEVGEGAVLGSVDEGFAPLETTLDRAAAALCAEMMGTAAQSFDMKIGRAHV